MNQNGSRTHKPTDELLMGVSAVEEHGQLGFLRQVKLLLKESAQVTVEEERGEGGKMRKANQGLHSVKQLIYPHAE